MVHDDLGRSEPEAGYTAAAHTTIGARSRRMTFYARTWLGDAWLDAGDEMVAPDPSSRDLPVVSCRFVGYEFDLETAMGLRAGVPIKNA